MTYDFDSRFEKLSGFVHRVSSTEEAAAKIGEICKTHKASIIALAEIDQPLTEKIEMECSGQTVRKAPFPADSLPDAIDSADIGITGISFAIAQSGTLVEISTDDATRLVSALPDTYIGILHAKDIIDKYPDGAALLRTIISEHDANLVISFISGPSRTGDIELKLALGVHGPREAHALIIE